MTQTLSLAPRAVVFDLDGTLLDTLGDIGDSANQVLAELGLPQHRLADYRKFVGDGVQMLIERILPEGERRPATIAQGVARFGQVYSDRWRATTKLYAGVRTLLSELAARSIPLAVLSNKPQAFTELCVERFLGEWPFQVVYGQREGVPRKPDPTAAIEIATRMGLPPNACAFLGDSSVDMHTACAAGMCAIGAAWGFRSVTELKACGAHAIAHHPCDLLPWLANA